LPYRKYTKPARRERLKAKIQTSDKDGRPGQWSARKSQLLVQQYEKQGDGYRGDKDAAQKHLKDWPNENWQKRNGSTRDRHGKTDRFLPEKAWEKLTPAQKDRPEKRRASRKGTQFVPNTSAATAARKSACEV
jgi:hypothetical protein